MLLINKNAAFNYNIEQTFQCGIALIGTEVKSIRSGQTNINNSHIVIDNNEVFALNWNISECNKNNKFIKHEPLRKKKLLLKKIEIKKLIGLINRKNYTIILTKCFSNKRGFFKVEIALVTAKKQHDKREYIKNRDQRREERIKFVD